LIGFLAKAAAVIVPALMAARPAAAIPWSRLPAAMALGGACFAVLVTALGFLIAAVYMALQPLWGSGWAAFAVGAALLPVAGVFGFLLYKVVSEPIAKPPLDLGELADEAMKGVDLAEDWIARRPLSALGGAVMLGAITALLLTQRRR
jgi:hypothetical protein